MEVRKTNVIRIPIAPLVMKLASSKIIVRETSRTDFIIIFSSLKHNLFDARGQILPNSFKRGPIWRQFTFSSITYIPVIYCFLADFLAVIFGKKYPCFDVQFADEASLSSWTSTSTHARHGNTSTALRHARASFLFPAGNSRGEKSVSRARSLSPRVDYLLQRNVT